jgi:toxin secretion/phage lysis holin
MLVVLVAAWMDRLVGSSWIRDAVCLAYVANEVISLIENAGLMGVPIPAALTKAIEILRSQADGQGGGKDD